MVLTHTRSLENQPESSTASDDHNVCLQQLNNQICEQEQQLAILHAQQQLNKLEVQIHGDTLIEPQLTQNITTEPLQNQSVNNTDDDNETPLRLKIKNYY
ncbi:repeat set, removed [Histoplasma ohiense]|nr:repeat set, removed [Histoplasma ohiense (nom. inval.)]